MEKGNPKSKGGFLSVIENIKKSVEKKRGAGFALRDLAVIFIGFLFGGCHVLFGAYPLGIGFIAALQRGVWLAFIGVALGSLTLGRGGVVYAMIALLVVMIRIIISGGDRRGGAEGEDSVFSEKLLLRMSAAIIGGFVAALYEAILQGLGLTVIAFGLVMIILPPVLTFLFSGAFSSELTVGTLISGKSTGISSRGASGKRFFDSIFFKISVASYLLLISFALKKYSFFGVDPAYVFSAAVTLFAAKRLGAVWGGVTGFISTVATSALGAAAFGLAGAAAGALFIFGGWYAVIGAGMLLSAFGAYASGLVGVLSYLPEYMIGAAFMLPFFKHIDRETAPNEGENLTRIASDMVGTMAITYQNEGSGAAAALRDSMSALCEILQRARGEGDISAEGYEIFSRILAATVRREEERSLYDEELSLKLEDIMRESGLDYPAAKALGGRRKHIICAARDAAGDTLSSPEFLSAVSAAVGLTLTAPEFYRRESMAALVTEAKASYRMSGAYSTSPGQSGEENGDRASIINTRDLYSYALLADGMGSGGTAGKNAALTAEVLRAILGAGADMDTAFHALNSILRCGEEECSVALDIFAFDRITGEGVFIKSGAAPSYIKRGKSLFRIKSATMPLGVLKGVDAERIASKIEVGDTVIMLSDGVLDGAEDCPWLVELLNRENGEDPRGLSEKILKEAALMSEGGDDMTAVVIKIGRVE